MRLGLEEIPIRDTENPTVVSNNMGVGRGGGVVF